MTSYPSKKKAAQAKTIDEVNWADHEPDGRRAAQEPVGEVTEVNDSGFKCEFNQRLAAGTKLYTIPPQPAQEPASITYKEVADAMNKLRKGTFEQRQIADEMENKRLYTSPPQRTWVGLTDEELSEFDVDPIEAKLMIARLKEKNT